MRKTEHYSCRNDVNDLEVSLTCLSFHSKKSRQSPKLFSPARYEEENLIPMKTPVKKINNSMSFIKTTPIKNQPEARIERKIPTSPQSESKYNIIKASKCTLPTGSSLYTNVNLVNDLFTKNQLMRPPLKQSFSKSESKNPFINNPKEQRAAKVVPAPPTNEEAEKFKQPSRFSPSTIACSPESFNKNKNKGDVNENVSLARSEIQTDKNEKKSNRNCSSVIFPSKKHSFCETPKQQASFNKNIESYNLIDDSVNPFGKEGKESKIVYQTPKQEISNKRNSLLMSANNSRCDNDGLQDQYEKWFQKNKNAKGSAIFSSQETADLEVPKADCRNYSNMSYNNELLLFEEVSEIVNNSRCRLQNASYVDQIDISHAGANLNIPTTFGFKNPATFIKKLSELKEENDKRNQRIAPIPTLKVERKDNITLNPVNFSTFEESLQNYSINDIVYRGASFVQTNRSQIHKLNNKLRNLDSSSRFETLRTKEDFQKEMIMLSIMSFDESVIREDDDDFDLIPEEGEKLKNIESLKQRLNSPRVKIQSQKLRGTFFKLLKRAQQYFIPNLIASIFYETGFKPTSDVNHKLLKNFRQTYYQMFDERDQAKGYKVPSDKEIAPMKLNIPRRPGYENKKTLLLDLDETLIHCNEDSSEPCDVSLSVKLPNGQRLNAEIIIRPHLKEFLKRMNKYYEIFIFTASHDAYARTVVDYIDKNRRVVQGYFSRNHCFCTEDGAYIKDLRILNRNLKDIVIVDNLIYSYAFQINNGVPILPFENNKNETELLSLIDYLKFVATMDDVRDVNKRFFRLDSFLNNEDPEESAFKHFADFIPKTEGLI